MQRAVAAFPKQATLPVDYSREPESQQFSGFFNEIAPSLSQSELAAVMALAVHRRLIEQPVRKQLPLR